MAAVTVLFLAAVTTAGVSPWLIGLLQRCSVVDHENGRTSHRGTVPRGGGLAILAGTIVALVVTSSQWIDEPRLAAATLFAVAFGLLGLIDDVRTLPALLRLGVQAALTVLFLLVSGVEPLPGLGVLGLIVSGLWLMGFVNAFNFMDGINGISSATTVIVGSSLAAASYRWDGGIELPALALVGGALGFAPFNALTGRVFLGDVGSYLLGSGLALLALLAVHNGVPILPVVLPCLLYIGDVAYTMVRRALRHEQILKSHREHVYQRMTNVIGWTHQRTTSVVALFTAVLVGLGHLAADVGTPLQVLTAMIGAMLVVGYLTLPLLFARQVRVAQTTGIAQTAGASQTAEAARTAEAAF